MALFKILRGNSSNLFDENGNISSTVPFNDGYCYFTPDNKKFYIDWLDKSNVQHRDPLNSLLADKLLSSWTDINNISHTETAKLVGFTKGEAEIHDSNEEVPTSAVLYAKFSDIENALVILNNNKMDAPFKPAGKSYLTFSSPSSFTLTVSEGSKGWNGTLEYFNSDKTWTVWDGTTALYSVDNSGEYALYLRGARNTKIAGYHSSWVLTGSNIACIGNIETLLDYAIVQEGNHPSMTDYCYEHMFHGCTALTQAPALPATKLDYYCYGFMFYGCTSLTQAPALPATTLANNCYNGMFHSCTSLTHAPTLPSTTLTTECYKSMFEGCTSLTKAPALPATTLAERCYSNMFYGCTALTQAPALPATTLADYCYQYMLYGCTKIKVSSTQTGEYTIVYRIPTTGTGTTISNALTGMFTNTGGTFTGTPSINTTYYLSTDNMVVRETDVATLRGYVGSMIDSVTPSMQTKITGNADDFVVIGSDGNVTTKTILNAEELSF